MFCRTGKDSFKISPDELPLVADNMCHHAYTIHVQLLCETMRIIIVYECASPAHVHYLHVVNGFNYFARAPQNMYLHFRKMRRRLRLCITSIVIHSRPQRRVFQRRHNNIILSCKRPHYILSCVCHAVVVVSE